MFAGYLVRVYCSVFCKFMLWLNENLRNLSGAEQSICLFCRLLRIVINASFKVHHTCQASRTNLHPSQFEALVTFTLKGKHCRIRASFISVWGMGALFMRCNNCSSRPVTKWELFCSLIHFQITQSIYLWRFKIQREARNTRKKVAAASLFVV